MCVALQFYAVRRIACGPSYFAVSSMMAALILIPSK